MQFSKDIWAIICGYVDPPTLRSIRSVCKTLLDVTKNDAVWKDILFRFPYYIKNSWVRIDILIRL